jgi:23S rRNA-intervening sequence protein
MQTAPKIAQQGSVRSHRDLLVWQKAIDLVDKIYGASDRFPPKEEYRLVSQLVRAAISVPTNIAEGSTRARHRRTSPTSLMWPKPLWRNWIPKLKSAEDGITSKIQKPMNYSD